MKRLCSTLLIVDDDPNDLFFALAAFRALQVTSTLQTVANGREAIAYLLGEGKYADRSLFAYPDFILTDLKMPEVDGFELLEHIRHNSASAMIPTVVLSGSHDNEDIEKAYRLGANSYHIKPNDPQELRQLLKALHSYWMLCELPAEATATDIHIPSNIYKWGSQSSGSSAPWFLNEMSAVRAKLGMGSYSAQLLKFPEGGGAFGLPKRV